VTISDGPNKVTLLHGVVDAPWIAFCLAPVTSSGEGPTSGAPYPPGGLEFGASATLGTDAGVDPKTDGIRAYVVAAKEASAVTGLDCPALVAIANTPPVPPLPPPPDSGREPGTRDAAVADARTIPPLADASMGRDGASEPFVDASLSRDAAADASATLDAAFRDATADASPTDSSVPVPGVRVSPLPVIPAGQLGGKASYLLVASGCLGGPGVTDPSQTSICGDSYSRDTPTLTPIVVALARVAPATRVALAFLNAAPGFSKCDVKLTPPSKGDQISLATDVAVGALRPRPPSTKSSSTAIGAENSRASIQLYSSGSSTATYDKPWSNTLDSSTVSALEDGTAYTLVYVGPFPGFSKRRWWNGPLVTIVEN
jgi:hypothetical protein